jgi:hypothetical protein
MMKQPNRIISYQMQPRTEYHYGGLYALDENGVIWHIGFKDAPDANGYRWHHEWEPLNLPD